MRWLYAGSDGNDADNEEYFLDHEDYPDHQEDDDNLDDYSDDCDHEPPPTPHSSLKGNGESDIISLNGQNVIEDFARQLKLNPLLTNGMTTLPPTHNGVTTTNAHDSDEKTLSPRDASPMPPALFLKDFDTKSDSLHCSKNSENKSTMLKVNGTEEMDVPDMNCENNFDMMKDMALNHHPLNRAKTHEQYHVSALEPMENGIAHVRRGAGKCEVSGSDFEDCSISDNEVSLRNSKNKKEGDSGSGIGETGGRTVNSEEDDDSLSCKEGGNSSAEENLVSERIDLPPQFRQNNRMVTSPSPPSSLSSTLSQHSQSSILNMINNHEAKCVASGTGRGLIFAYISTYNITLFYNLTIYQSIYFHTILLIKCRYQQCQADIPT